MVLFYLQLSIITLSITTVVGIVLVTLRII